GGSEHATGHLLYARFWNKFLKDRGFAPTEEPFKKLINQGMILGMSAFVYRIKPYPPHSSNIEFKGGNLIELTNDFPYSFLISKNLIDNVVGLKSGTKEYNEIVDL